MVRLIHLLSANDACPPEALLPGADFGREGDAWFWAEVDGVRIERFLADEDGIRAELNVLAAIDETRQDDPIRLERIVTARQLFTIQGPEPDVRRVADILANATGGLLLEDASDG